MRDSINYAGLAHHVAFIRFVREWAGRRKAMESERIAELEAALTDALWAYGVVRENIDQYYMCVSSTERDVKDADERIQKARAVLTPNRTRGIL